MFALFMHALLQLSKGCGFNIFQPGRGYMMVTQTILIMQAGALERGICSCLLLMILKTDCLEQGFDEGYNILSS